MWLCLNDAFLSIVALPDHPDELLVRARIAGDIERLFPVAQVIAHAGTDYRYRARLPRQQVAAVVAARVQALDYTNFKNSVRDEERHQTYYDLWERLYVYQQEQPDGT